MRDFVILAMNFEYFMIYLLCFLFGEFGNFDLQAEDNNLSIICYLE